MKFTKWLPCAILALTTGCVGGVRPVASEELLLAYEAGLPAPERADQLTATRQYLVGPGDKLRIDAYALDDLSREVLVDGAGWVSFPIAGAINVNGLEPRQIADLLTQKLKQAYIRNPEVSVNLIEADSQNIAIEGEVKEPGLYSVINHSSLLRLVAAAKGTTEFANDKNVVILRTVNDRRYAGVYNLNSIRSGRYPDPKLYSNDVVLVGDSLSKRRLDTVIQISAAVLAPLVFVIQ